MIEPDELLFMAVTSNMLEDVLENNKTKVDFEVKRDINIALKAVNRVTKRLYQPVVIDLLDQYKDNMNEHFNELFEKHSKL